MDEPGLSMNKGILLALLFIFSLTGVSAQDVNALLAERLKADPIGSAFSVGVVTETGTKFYNVGKVSKDPNAKPVTENTVYELGSITKVFVGILLAEAVKRGEVKLDDPISKHLPVATASPKFNGKEITLLDLTTHTSSLPRLPANLAPANPYDPYADYSAKDMYAFLGQVKLDREIGSRFEYSNFGVGLLGHILSLKARLPFEQLVKTRILDPLGMKNTAVTLSADMKANLATGHDSEGKPTNLWNFDVLAGAGALRSTAADMAKFIAANLGFTKTPISDSLAEAMVLRRTGGAPIQKIGLGWHGDQLSDRVFTFHGGGTGGFVTLVGLDRDRKTGVFLATNSTSKSDDLAVHILVPEFPLRKIKQPVVLTESTLAKYVGEYELAPGFTITVTREGSRIFLQATNQPKFEMFGEKQDEFYLKVVDAKIIFKKDADGNVTGLTLKQGGRDLPGKKVK
jgi:serine-type D-Ala-D-Ala carboxypeptidase/endopeptidase